MSTISLPHEKQIRHFFLMDGIAAETTIATFIASASIGEIQLFDTGGGVASASTVTDFTVTKVNNKGTISKSDQITGGDISYLKGNNPVSKVGKSQTFTLTGAPTVGDEYRIMGKIHYGNSEENFITFVVGDVAVTGDTTDSLLARLATKLSANLAFSMNTKSKNPATVTIGGVAAEGSVQLSAGASGSVDTLTVDGVSLIDAAVAFDTSLDITAAALGAAINAKATSPNYTASVSTDTVTITAVDPGVFTGTVASTTTTLTSVDVDMGTVTAGTSTLTATDNKYFQISQATGSDALVITETDWILDDFRVGLRTHDQLMWNFEFQAADDVITNVTKSATVPVYAAGQGYQIIELERYLVGHRAETTDLLDSTLGFGRDYDTVIASSYYTLDLKYFDISRDDPKHSDKMLTIASTSAADMNTIGLIIEGMMA